MDAQSTIAYLIILIAAALAVRRLVQMRREWSLNKKCRSNCGCGSD